MRILIAEDGFVPRKLLMQQLSILGEIDVAANGDEAVMATKLSFEENQPYELIFLDIQMPGVNGLQALKKIREMESKKDVDPNDRSKIIMITAHSDKNKVVTAAKQKCDAYLIKPVTKPRLFEALEELGVDISGGKSD
jgi:two-component system chemotaxis response regulator CheY